MINIEHGGSVRLAVQRFGARADPEDPTGGAKAVLVRWHVTDWDTVGAGPWADGAARSGTLLRRRSLPLGCCRATAIMHVILMVPTHPL